jgi:hypothetical protein
MSNSLAGFSLASLYEFDLKILMLQIITGKFFTSDKLNVTHHRAVLYTNYGPSLRLVQSSGGASLGPAIFETAVGSMSSMNTGTSSDQIFPWLYEVDEKLEADRPDGTKDFLLGVGAEYLVQDFAAVAAFALNITCTPDLDLTRRLVLGQHGALGLKYSPKHYVDRVFDSRIEPQEQDASLLKDFVRDLVGLERRTYKAVMRSIRRYVTGLHRFSDDLDLAYAMLVASIESLSQGFDAFTPTWEDYDQEKRTALDKALLRVPADIAENLRNVLLTQEHHALARRYREFALAHLRPSFFRQEALGETSPVRLNDLPGALERAYVFRSRYVHTVLELPRNLTVAPSKSDWCRVEGAPALTFHGLARIARHVIREFIACAPKCQSETLDYRQELPNKVRMQLAFSMWGPWSSAYDHKSARRYLGGFLQDITAFLTSVNPTTVRLTNVRPLVEKVEALVPGLAKAEQRLPLLTLYVLFHLLSTPEHHRPNCREFVKRYADDFGAPSVESMLVHVLEDSAPEWTLEEFEEIRRSYFKQRYLKNGLEFGATLEAAVTLFSAEMHRQQGYEDRARALVSETVENLPGRPSLLEFESGLAVGPLPAIDWRALLLPASPVVPAL